MIVYRNVYNRKKSDDRGFTLVELIIVVAILAVLVGMLAPQYTKYVEKSRKAADVSNMDKIIRSIQTAVVDPDYYEIFNPNGKAKESFYQIKITEKGTEIGKKDFANQTAYSIRGRDFLNLSKALKEYYGKDWTTVTMKSRRWDPKYVGPYMYRIENVSSLDGIKCIFAEVWISAEGQVKVLKYEPNAFAEAISGNS